MTEHKSRFEKRHLVNVPDLLVALGINDTVRRGKSIVARCPAHPDRNPSWSILDDPHSSRSGSHYCFSCQFGGGPAALVRQVRSCTWEEAFDFLKVAPAPEHALEVDVVIGLFAVGQSGMQVPSEVKVRPLEEWPTAARDYLLARNVTSADVVRFDLGFAQSGRLAGRIVLPMKDRDGRIVSYTARDYTGQGKRYLEPAKHENALKSALFGEHTWLGSQVATGLIVTEGTFDAMAAARAVHPSPLDVCGLHGSRLHPMQAVKFSRYPLVIVATDSDPAGDSVAEEIRIGLGRYSTVVRARPPEGQDCASLSECALDDLIGRAIVNAPTPTSRSDA